MVIKRQGARKKEIYTQKCTVQSLSIRDTGPILEDVNGILKHTFEPLMAKLPHDYTFE